MDSTEALLQIQEQEIKTLKEALAYLGRKVTTLEQELERVHPTPPPKEYWLSPEGVDYAKELWGDQNTDVVRIYLDAWLTLKGIVSTHDRGSF